MFTNKDKQKYKEENVNIDKILPTHNTRRHRIFNAFTKKAFGTSVYTREELVSFFRSLIRINYYNCSGEYKNNNDIVNTAIYCKEDLDNFNLLGNKIKIKVTCEDNKTKEIKLKYFFRKIHEMGYYLKDSLLNNEDVDKCMINDLLTFLKMYDIDLEKILPHIMLGYTMLDNAHNMNPSNTGTKYINKLVSKDVNRSTTSKLTRRHSFKRANQETIGNCWAWASVRMILKFIQNIIKFHPHNEILDIEVSKSVMNEIYHFNNFTNFFLVFNLTIPKHQYNINNVRLKNVTIYIFCVLLIDHYNPDISIYLNNGIILNPTKVEAERGVRSITFIFDFLKGIKNIKNTLEKLNFFKRFEFNEVQQNIIIDFFDEFENYMNDYNYKIHVKTIRFLNNQIYNMNIDSSKRFNRTDENTMKVIDVIIEIIKKYNLYIYFGIDLSTIPSSLEKEFLDKHPFHALVITQYSSKKNKFIIENSWGKKYSTFLITKEQLLEAIKKHDDFIFQYIYPTHYKGILKGYKPVSNHFDPSTASLDDRPEYLKSVHPTSKRRSSKRYSSPKHSSSSHIHISPRRSSSGDSSPLG